MNSLIKEIGLRLGYAVVNSDEAQSIHLKKLVRQLEQLEADGLRDDFGTSRGASVELALRIRKLGGDKLPGKYTIQQLRGSPEWQAISDQLESIDRLSVHGIFGRIEWNEDFYHHRTRLEFRNLTITTRYVRAPKDKTFATLRDMGLDQLLQLRGIRLPSAIFIALAFGQAEVTK